MSEEKSQFADLLVANLRTRANLLNLNGKEHVDTMWLLWAADRLEQLEAERDKLRGALENLVLFINSEHDLHAVFVTKDSPAFAAARTALGKEEPTP